MRILIVEDDFINIKVLKAMADTKGETDLALDGNEAIEAIKKALDEGTPFDLIVLDIMMPEKDGLEALREIRELEAAKGLYPGGQGSASKIIMCTASTEKKDFLKAFREQCDGFLQKPVTPERFNEALEKVGL